MPWNQMYKEPPAMSAAIDSINKVSERHGMSPMNVAYRWVVYHSPLKHGDGVIFGARNNEQLKANIEAVNAGPLPEEVVKVIEHVWGTIEHVAPGDY